MKNIWGEDMPPLALIWASKNTKENIKMTESKRKNKKQRESRELANGLKTAPASAGKTMLIAHMEGKPITLKSAVTAKCCECNGYYNDGRIDCKMPDCPLYPWMPYQKKKTDGGVKFEDEQAA